MKLIHSLAIIISLLPLRPYSLRFAIQTCAKTGGPFLRKHSCLISVLLCILPLQAIQSAVLPYKPSTKVSGSDTILLERNGQKYLLYIAPYKDNKRCAISYTFDDGLSEHCTWVAPKLESFGFRGTFWIVGNNIETRRQMRGADPMTWQQISELAARGHEVSNHGWSHRNLTKLTAEEIRTEIARNDSAIEAHTGIRPRTFCYPGNGKNDLAVSIASEGRVATRTFQRSIGGGKGSQKELDAWVKDLLSTGGWGVGMTHGITHGYDAYGDPTPFIEHLKHVKSMEGSIWVAPFVEVASYIKERESLKWSIRKDRKTADREKNRKGLILTPFLPLDHTLYNENLTLVIETQDGHKYTYDLNPFLHKTNLLLP